MGPNQSRHRNIFLGTVSQNIIMMTFRDVAVIVTVEQLGHIVKIIGDNSLYFLPWLFVLSLLLTLPHIHSAGCRCG